MTADELFLSGFEFLFFSDDRIESVIAEMIGSGKITKEEASKIRRSLVRKAEDEKKRFVGDLERVVAERVAALRLVPAEEFERLEARVRVLESFIDEQARSKKRK